MATENQMSAALENHFEKFRESLRELQSSMDEKLKQIVKNIGEVRVSNQRAVDVIPDLKIIPPTPEQTKAAVVEDQGTNATDKVFDKKSTSGTSNRNVLISGYDQTEDCLYAETFDYVPKRVLISDFNQDEDYWCVETYKNVMGHNFLDLAKEDKKNMVNEVQVENKETKEGNAYFEASYEVFDKLSEEDHMAYTFVVIECAKTDIRCAYLGFKITIGMPKEELDYGRKKLFIFDPDGGCCTNGILSVSCGILYILCSFPWRPHLCFNCHLHFSDLGIMFKFDYMILSFFYVFHNWKFCHDNLKFHDENFPENWCFSKSLQRANYLAKLQGWWHAGKLFVKCYAANQVVSFGSPINKSATPEIKKVTIKGLLNVGLYYKSWNAWILCPITSNSLNSGTRKTWFCKVGLKDNIQWVEGSFLTQKQPQSSFFPDKAKLLAFSVSNELVKELRNKPCPIVFAAFFGGSKACMYKVFQIIQGISEAQLNLSGNQLVTNCISGQIYDSSSVDFTGDSGSTFVIHSTILRMLSLVKIASLVAKGVTYSPATLFLTRFGSQRFQYWRTLYSLVNMGSTYLILCSENDDIAPYSIICNFVQCFSALEERVHFVKLNGSTHIGHFKHSPFQYLAAVTELFQKAVLVFAAMILKYCEKIGLEGMHDEISDLSCDLQSASVDSNQSLRRIALGPNDYSLPSSAEHQIGGDYSLYKLSGKEEEKPIVLFNRVYWIVQVFWDCKSLHHFDGFRLL